MAALKKSLVNVGTQIGHTTAACKTRGEIKCFINVIKVKSCLINEPRWIIRLLASDLRASLDPTTLRQCPTTLRQYPTTLR